MERMHGVGRVDTAIRLADGQARCSAHRWVAFSPLQ